MGDVVNFPGFDARQWLAMETQLADGLAKIGVPAEQAEWIRAEWKRRAQDALLSLRYSVDLIAPEGTSPEAIDFAKIVAHKVEKQFQPLVESLLGQLLMAVAELAAIKFSSPAPALRDAKILHLVSSAQPED